MNLSVKDLALLQTSNFGFSSIQAVLFVISLANVVVICIIIGFPQLHTVTNTHIGSLCVADCLYCSVLPLFIERHWPFGLFLCKASFMLETIGKYASIWFITILAFDRYLVICRSTWAMGKRTNRSALIGGVCLWIGVLLLSLPFLIYATTVPFRNATELCTIKWPDKNVSNGYSRTTFVVTFLIPVIITLVCYIRILISLRKAKSRTKRLNREEKDAERYQRATRLVLIVIGFYLASWTPIWTYNAISTLMLNIRMGVRLKIMFDFMHVLPYINAAINPIIYAFLTSEFRTVVRQTCGAKK